MSALMTKYLKFYFQIVLFYYSKIYLVDLIIDRGLNGLRLREMATTSENRRRDGCQINLELSDGCG